MLVRAVTAPLVASVVSVLPGRTVRPVTVVLAVLAVGAATGVLAALVASVALRSERVLLVPTVTVATVGLAVPVATARTVGRELTALRRPRPHFRPRRQPEVTVVLAEPVDLEATAGLRARPVALVPPVPRAMAVLVATPATAVPAETVAPGRVGHPLRLS
jgi:hypothetical protein